MSVIAARFGRPWREDSAMVYIMTSALSMPGCLCPPRRAAVPSRAASVADAKHAEQRAYKGPPGRVCCPPEGGVDPGARKAQTITGAGPRIRA